MARPIKEGLEYFPLDVHAFEDPKLIQLRYKFGPIGQFVYIRILTLVYERGYYVEKTADELALEIHMLLGPQWIRVEKVSEMIDYCVELGLLERAFFIQGVITSWAIQQQFLHSTKRRKKINIDKYWLLDSATMEKNKVLLSMQKNEVIDDNNSVNVDNNSVDVIKNTQSNSYSNRDKKIKKDKSIYGYPKMHFITEQLIKRKYIEDSGLDVLKYNNLFDECISNYGYDWVFSAVNYIIKYSKNPGEPIDDRFSFMKVALINNLERFRRKEERGNETIEQWFESNFLRLRR